MFRKGSFKTNKTWELPSWYFFIFILYILGFKCKLDVCAIFDLRIDMLSVDFLEAEVKAEEEEDIEFEEVE